MADWTNIQDSQVDPDSPVTSELGYAFRDNPIAISEGATGAPRILDAALSTNVTNAGSAWVFNRIINRAHGGVGQSVFCAFTGPNPGSVSFGSVVPGSDLRVSNAAGTTGGMPTPAGSWRCMGQLVDSASAPGNTSLFQRIS